MPPLNRNAAAVPNTPRRIGKASPSVSIFSRDHVGVEHDDHTCYSCEQRLLHPGGVPGAPWQPPLPPGCESWCAHQRCAVRRLHELHVCMDCEHAMKISTPAGGWRGLVPRPPLQKPPSRGLEGSGGEGGGGGRRSEGRRGLHLRKASRGLEGGFKGA